MMLKRNLFLITLLFLIDLNQFTCAYRSSTVEDDHDNYICYPDLGCCDGYKKTNGRCRPFCPDGCVHGQCNNPNDCECAINFGGSNCNRTCSPGSFGLDCEKDCEYLTDPKRNVNYANCDCKLYGLTGSCKDICKCRTNLCSVGFIGKKCEIPCPDGSFGQHCSKNCTCIKKNTSNCNPESGDCLCKKYEKKGYYGLNCELKCNGILNCPIDSTHNCTCELTLEQKIDGLIKKQSLQLQNLKDIQYLSLILLFFIILIPIIMVIFFKLRNKWYEMIFPFPKSCLDRTKGKSNPTSTSHLV